MRPPESHSYAALGSPPPASGLLPPPTQDADGPSESSALGPHGPGADEGLLEEGAAAADAHKAPAATPSTEALLSPNASARPATSSHSAFDCKAARRGAPSSWSHGAGIFALFGVSTILAVVVFARSWAAAAAPQKSDVDGSLSRAEQDGKGGALDLPLLGSGGSLSSSSGPAGKSDRRQRAVLEAGAAAATLQLEEEVPCAMKYVENCWFSRCCRDRGFTCYKKNAEWAACTDFCRPWSYNPGDHGIFRTPWECSPLRKEDPMPKVFFEPPQENIEEKHAEETIEKAELSQPEPVDETSPLGTELMVRKVARAMVRQMYTKMSSAVARGEPPDGVPPVVRIGKAEWSKGYVVCCLALGTAMFIIVYTVWIYTRP